MSNYPWYTVVIGDSIEQGASWPPIPSTGSSSGKQNPAKPKPVAAAAGPRVVSLLTHE